MLRLETLPDASRKGQTNGEDCRPPQNALADYLSETR